MNRKISGILFFIVLVIISIPTYTAASSIQLKVDGAVIPSEIGPEIKNGRTMVPLRVISENLGAKVDWSKSKVTLTKKICM